LWRRESGQSNYPDADEILAFCDGGGINSSSTWYNLIEHCVFPHVTRSCKGVPLETIETAKHYMEKTETAKGLKVIVRIIDKVFEKGRKYAADFMQNMAIQFDELLPKWNYTAVPQTD